VNCRYCGVAMAPGIAMGQTVTGSPDFADGPVVTMSPGGPGAVIPCLKCPVCGYSVSLAPHQQHAVEERDQLAERITQMTAFEAGELFVTLCEAEQRRMRSQLVAMDEYLAILNERIAAF
jgi:hypothetical protein